MTNDGTSTSDTEECDHPLGSIERRGEPDWKNGSKTIWYYGFCMDCGADVEVEYRFDRTVERKKTQYGYTET